jgi:hypothetical protein
LEPSPDRRRLLNWLLHGAKALDYGGVVRRRDRCHPFAVDSLLFLFRRPTFGALRSAMAAMRHGVLVAWLTAPFPTEHSFSTFRQNLRLL